MTVTASDRRSLGFEELYFALRAKEGRIYADEDLLFLPTIKKDHPHYTEWQLRKESCNQLKQYFIKKLKLLKILEVGCGNGWLSHQLAGIPGCDVTGIDVNFSELQQAVRVFSHIPRLQFIYGSITAKEIIDEKYDFIVFAASIQYFSSLEEIIGQALSKLKSNGEIHIMDSPFYNPVEIVAAEKRTRDYYFDHNFPEMTGHYFHHTKDELASFLYKILYQPSFINHHILNKKNPFPWLCIKKQA